MPDFRRPRRPLRVRPHVAQPPRGIVAAAAARAAAAASASAWARAAASASAAAAAAAARAATAASASAAAAAARAAALSADAAPRGALPCDVQRRRRRRLPRLARALGDGRLARRLPLPLRSSLAAAARDVSFVNGILNSGKPLKVRQIPHTAVAPRPGRADPGTEPWVLEQHLRSPLETWLQQDSRLVDACGQTVS